MGYTGNSTVDEMKSECKFVRITNAGLSESHVHDVEIRGGSQLQEVDDGAIGSRRGCFWCTEGGLLGLKGVHGSSPVTAAAM